MNIGILVMSTPFEPSTRNIMAMKQTFIKSTERMTHEKRLKHHYDFYIYEGTENALGDVNAEIIPDTQFVDIDVYDVKINIEESVYRTFEKTYEVFKVVADKYDWIVRINISTFLNIPLLDHVLEMFETDCVYCNALNAVLSPECAYFNDMYPRGDMFILSNETMKGIIEYGEKYLYCDRALKDRPSFVHVDDVCIGVSLIDYYTANHEPYFLKYKVLEYNFMSGVSALGFKFNANAIGTRLKTIPPDEHYSGYSWDDNKWRRCDAVKMRICDGVVNGLKPERYSQTEMKDVLATEDNIRQVCVCIPKNISPHEKWYMDFLTNKRSLVD